MQVQNWCGFAGGVVTAIGNYRHVYRSEVYLAGNGYMGRMGAAATDHFFTITLTGFPNGVFGGPLVEDCLGRMYRNLADALPGQIRPHPGKRHGLLLDEGVAPAVYALLSGYDPTGVFR
jgi:hypothetical protein